MSALAWNALAADIRERMGVREPAHDFLHVTRVVKNVETICAAEKDVDPEIARTAALLHELVTFKKDDPRSPTAGDACATAARELLVARGADASFAEAVATAIADHAFSKGAAPRTRESAVLQDADRLDAIGAIGIARCFATCADMKGAFYNQIDPQGKSRDLDDKAYALDHFAKKLFLIQGRLHTDAARAIAKERTKFMRAYVEQLLGEI